MKNNNKEFDTNYFVMSPKSIVLEYDLVTASLYGLIWSFSQMELGYCKLSQPQMAEKLGYKSRCINAKFANLKKSNLIKILFRERFPDGGVLLHTVCNKEALLQHDEKYKDRLRKTNAFNANNA
jgi:hypothetical protein